MGARLQWKNQMGVRDEGHDQSALPRAPEPHDRCRRVTRAPSDQLERLCRAAVSVTGVNSCGVTMLTDGGQSVTAHASAPQAQAVEDLQHTLGEGPGVDASLSGAAADRSATLEARIAPEFGEVPEPVRGELAAVVLAVLAAPHKFYLPRCPLRAGSFVRPQCWPLGRHPAQQ